ncbi:MAG: ATP-binding protein [Acidobacteriota bacterium]|nr:ATP-binding protein [Acidobacteriota bacterium]
MNREGERQFATWVIAGWVVFTLALGAAHTYLARVLALGWVADVMSHLVLLVGGLGAVWLVVRWSRRARVAEARRRELEVHLNRVERLEAVGTLAGGIAHDFNNALFVMTGYTEMALEQVPAESRVRADLEEVLESARRARDLVQQLLVFARGSSGERVALQVGPVVKETVKLLRAGLPAQVECVARVDDGDLRVFADPADLHQLILHLGTNAVHAMGSTGGRLEIDLQAVEIGDDRTFKDIESGPYLRLQVRDTGPGIDPSLRERIFEPFFTTRAPGEGTGMGLSVVHGIVTRLGGAVTVESRPGEGATFTVHVPATRGIKAEEQAAAGPIPRGEGRILFVDDDPALVSMISRVFHELGFDVVAATDPLAALRRFEAKPHGYDLLIADLVMRPMGGCELATAMRRLRPELPVILCTGHGNAGSVDAEAFPFLMLKPLGIRELREAIDRARGSAGTGRDSGGAR